MASKRLVDIGRVLGFIGMIALVILMIYKHSVWVGSVKEDRAAEADAQTDKTPRASSFQTAVEVRQQVVMSNTAQKAKTFAVLTEDDLLPVRDYFLDLADIELGYLEPITNAAGTNTSVVTYVPVGDRQPQRIERVYRVQTIAENLLAPDGLAINPATRDIYVSEKEPGRIRLLRRGMLSHVVDNGTVIYRNDPNRRPSGIPLRMPEGIHFARNGDLYVTEDLPDGRLIRFPMQAEGKYTYGEEVPLPGEWDGFAWESVAIGPRGDLLLSGSDMKRETRDDENRLFSGAMIYRDPEGNWWVPYDRLFARFSSVIFSKSGRHAVYACELTGELGWIDLTTRRPVGGMSRHVPDTPEGICALPDGTYMVAERGGRIIHINPATDEKEVAVRGLNSIESIVWDPAGNRILVSDTESGRILAVLTDHPFEEKRDLFDYAIFHPNYSPQHIPEECPEYLRKVLQVGGLDGVDFEKAYVSFRDFAARVPLIAAKAEAQLVSRHDTVGSPIKQVQFVVFEPNKMLVEDEADEPTTLAAFAVVKEDGAVLKTSLVKLLADQKTQYARLDEEERQRRNIFVPRTKRVAVSMLGIAAIQFSGLGVIPDYSLVLNPWNDRESYLVEFREDGEQFHYRLKAPQRGDERDLWVLAYSHSSAGEWPLLAAASGEEAGADLSAQVYREREAKEKP